MDRKRFRSPTNRKGAADSPTGPCPLCAGTASRFVMAIDFARIWKTLESVYRVPFESHTIERHTPHRQARLWECASCGLQFFDPVVAGDSDFWGTLMRTAEPFYHAHSPEFQVVLDLVRPGTRVLDVGCGLGTFVAAASVLGAVSIGLELNETAAAAARSRGVDVRTESVEEFAVRNQADFDTVTIFQVIEHVESILPFVIAAYSCLKPGGLLFISAPYRDRLRPAGFEVLDHPPHHVTRWNEKPIRWLVARLGAELTLEYQRLDERQALGFRVGRLFSTQGGLTLTARNALVKMSWLVVFSPFGSFLRTYLRRRGWLGGYGHTFIARIRKPTDSGRPGSAIGKAGA